jgi:signal transduction histidine kinase/CheY-like chemotaxis protein
MHPLYRGGQVPATLQERREAIVGFSSFVYQTPANAIGNAFPTRLRGVDFRLHDAPAGRLPDAGEDEARRRARLADRSRPSELIVHARPELAATFQTSRPWQAAGGAMLLTLLIGGHVMRSSAQAAQVRRSVAERTAELAEANRSLAREIEMHRQAESEKLRLESQLLQSQKLEAIGTLAGGVAHDFNNLLAGILGYAGLLKVQIDPKDDRHRAVETIERAAERAAELTRQLLGFARKGKMQQTRVDLHETIEEVFNLLGRTIDKSIEVVRSLDARSACVLGDPSQLQQIILNLAVNARDAMPEGGSLKIETRDVEMDERDCRQYPEAAPGRYVTLLVSDTGRGIPPENRDRIFEPFFTTKPKGEGSGMGLAMVYGIVKSHGGFISVYSEPGVGSTFRVFLPLASESVAEAPPPRTEGPPARGSGRILVIDDEEIVRDMTSDLLESLGYDVVTARDGREGLEVYEAMSATIDLAIVDMIMPRMGGRDCFRGLKRLNPDVRVILSSGYGHNEAAQEILDEGARAFVQKPYQVRELSRLVADALN